jgi:clan AA aspartic protease
MIRGIVTDELEAVIRFTVLGPKGRKLNIEAVIDTGFDGFLSLSPIVISQLGLRWFKRGRAQLADGSDSVFDVFQATAIWDRRRVEIFVDEADTVPLVGMSLMSNFELRSEIWPGGNVSLKRRT